MKTKKYRMRVILLSACVAAAFPVITGCASTKSHESAGEFIDDSVITTKVKTALARDDAVNGFAVSVETYRGVVQLSGFVKTAEEKAKAAADARSVAGVVEVQNNISLNPPPPAAK